MPDALYTVILTGMDKICHHSPLFTWRIQHYSWYHVTSGTVGREKILGKYQTIKKNVNMFMGVPSRYNFKQSPRVLHPCQHISEISHKWLKICWSFCRSIFIRKAELISRKPPREDFNNVLLGWWTGGNLKIIKEL